MASSNKSLDEAEVACFVGSELTDDSYLLSALFEHTTDRIYFKDAESRFVRINHCKAQLLSLSDPREVIGKTDQDFLADEHAAVRRQDEIDLMRTGRPLIGKEEREEWPDGSVTWTSTSKMPLFNSVGKCIGTFGISRDITRVKRAEEAARNTQRDAELFIDSVPSILIGLDPSGRIQRWNLAATQAFGMSMTEVAGRPFNSCGIKWLDQPDIDSGITLMSERGEPARLDLRFEKNGEERLLGLTLRWITRFGSDSSELVIVGADVTERKRADEELLWKTAFLQAQTNSTGEGILVVDSNGKILLQNRTMQLLFDVPQDIIDIGNDAPLLKHFLTIVRDPEHFSEKIKYLYEHTDQTSRDEIYCVDGRVLEQYSSPVLGKSDKYYGRIWTFRDITERKRNETTLRQLSMAVEQSPASVVITDLRGRITYVNRKFTQVSGYESQEVVGKNSRILKSGQSSPAEYEQLWKTIISGGEWRGVFQNRRKDGGLYWESAVIRPMEDREGTTSHYLGLKEDITERLAMEAHLRQSQKLEAIGQLAAGIAHEINTPIQYIGDNASFLKDSWDQVAGILAAARTLRNELKPGTVSQTTIDVFDRCCEIADVDYLVHEVPLAIDQMIDGVRRVAGIVGAMKEFSHPGSQEKRAVDLNRAIETTLTISRNEWKYIAETQTILDRDLPLVPCLAGEINQVLLNLVVNASHAIAEAQCENKKLGLITLSTRRDGDCVEISVTDTGIGIPDHIKERVFDPFFTTKEVGKGTGQGLMLAHTVIVKKHGGRIWFESRPGRGTTFYIRLPITA